MRPLAPAVISVTLALISTTGSRAANLKHQPTHALRMGTTTFHLAVAGTPARDTTFWVSYGPLGGRFGVVQLHSHDNHRFSGRADLPLDAPGTFTYLQAQGTEIVHGLPQPGGIPVVIKSMVAVTALSVAQRTVHWSVPLG